MERTFINDLYFIVYMENNLGSYLKQIRKKQNLTLRDVQAATGISNAYLSQLENGKSTHPSPKILHKLAKVYKLSYEFLMKLVGYPVIGEERTITPFYRIQSDYQELSQDERNQVIDYIQFLKSKRKKQ